MAGRDPVDAELRAVIAAIQGIVREPIGRSFHIHQLDGVRTEAMVHLDAGGVRIEWVHGKGDCAITGGGAAITAVLRGEGSPHQLEADGSLVLYGDRELIDQAAEIFAPPPA